MTRIAAAVRAAGADIVVLPELATSGYVFASREEAGSVAFAGRAGVVGPRAARGRRVLRARSRRRVYNSAEGPERGVEWVGGSCVISPDGWVVDGADVDLAVARDMRLREYSDALADRPPELYGGLADTAANA